MTYTSARIIVRMKTQSAVLPMAPSVACLNPMANPFFFMGMPDASKVKSSPASMAEMHQAMVNMSQYSNMFKMYMANMGMQNAAGLEAAQQQQQPHHNGASETRDLSPQAPSTPAISTPTNAAPTVYAHRDSTDSHLVGRNSLPAAGTVV